MSEQTTVRSVSYWLAEIGEKVILMEEFTIAQYLSNMTQVCLEVELYDDKQKLQAIKNLYAAAEQVRQMLVKAKAEETR